MKLFSFLLTFSLAMVLVNAFNTKEHVRSFFRPEYRKYLPETGSSLVQDLEDESALANAPQDDDSTKCLSVCEPKCDRLNVPDYLTRNTSFFQFQYTPINCVLASTVVFSRRHKCQWLCLYLFDCCRACNAKHFKCIKLLGRYFGGPEYCYRENYKCMCKCLEKHNPPENYKKFPALKS